MNYTEIKREIQKIALRQPNVNSFSGTDPYEELNKPNIQYSTVLCGLESANRNDNTIQYNVILYYVDRLTRNGENIDSVKDDGIMVLQSIISNLPDDITYYTPVQYTPFEQQFADYCGGAYARVMLESEFEQGNCGIDDYVEELKTLYITKNGLFDVTGYTYVDVDVKAKLTYKLIEENGIFVPKGSDGFNVVEVNVPTMEGITEEECREIVESYDYATKSELPSLDGYATEQYVNTGLEEKQDKGDYALRSELPDLTNYATKDEIPSLDGYATEQWVEDKGYLTEHQSLDGYATEQWVEDKGYLTEHQDLSDYAKKDEIPSLDGYAKTVDVNTGLDSKQDKGDYALRSELPVIPTFKTINGEEITGEGDITITVPSLDGYATEEWVNEQGYLTEHQDLSEYAKKTDIPSLDGYATEEWVESQGYLTEHQTLKTINGESIIGEGNIVIQGETGDYYEKLSGIEMKQNGLGHPSIQLTRKREGSDETYVTVSDNQIRFGNNTTGKTGLTMDEDSISTRGTGRYFEFGARSYDTIGYVNNDNNYYNMLEFWPDADRNIDDGFYGGICRRVVDTQNDIDKREWFATESWVESQGYLTEHQDLSEYAKKTDIPSLDGYATEEWVNNQGFSKAVFEFDEATATLNIITA